MKIIGIIVVGIVFLICFYYIGKLNGIFFAVDNLQDNRRKELRLDFFCCARNYNKENQLNMEQFFINRGYRNILIYGLGKYYYDFINDFDILDFDHIYLGDRFGSEKMNELGEKVYSMDEIEKQNILSKIDVIVITSISNFIPIQNELKGIGAGCDILSYEDLVYNLRREY